MAPGRTSSWLPRVALLFHTSNKLPKEQLHNCFLFAYVSMLPCSRLADDSGSPPLDFCSHRKARCWVAWLPKIRRVSREPKHPGPAPITRRTLNLRTREGAPAQLSLSAHHRQRNRGRCQRGTLLDHRKPRRAQDSAQVGCRPDRFWVSPTFSKSIRRDGGPGQGNETKIPCPRGPLPRQLASLHRVFRNGRKDVFSHRVMRDGLANVFGFSARLVERDPHSCYFKGRSRRGSVSSLARDRSSVSSCVAFFFLRTLGRRTSDKTNIISFVLTFSGT